VWLETKRSRPIPQRSRSSVRRSPSLALAMCPMPLVRLIAHIHPWYVLFIRLSLQNPGAVLCCGCVMLCLSFGLSDPTNGYPPDLSSAMLIEQHIHTYRYIHTYIHTCIHTYKFEIRAVVKECYATLQNRTYSENIYTSIRSKKQL
jgi:hypothetical protein